MTPHEVRAARERLGFSQERLAAELAVTEGEVRLWEESPGVIPRRYAQQLAWQVAVRAQEEAMAASGLPECEWVRAWDQQPMPQRMDQQRRRLESLTKHVQACEVCQARERFARDHLPPLPEPPLPGWIRVISRFSDAVQRLPPWARPAAYGAAFIGAMTLFRALITMLATGPSLALLGMAAIGLLVGASLGAVGGLVYHAVHEPFRRFGRAGPYLTGVVVVVAYLLVAFGTFDLAVSEDAMLGSAAGWTIVGIVSVVFGMLIGHWWFRDPSPDA